MAPQSLSLKGQLIKSLCTSFRYNPRNMENHWYGFWTVELHRITEPFNNIVIIPQYVLWFTLPAEEPEFEEVDEVDEDVTSEVDVSYDEDEGKGCDGGRRYQSDSEDELDCFRDTDESAEPITEDKLTEDEGQDPDISIAQSLFSNPEGSAPQLVPDFVALHILAKKLGRPTSGLLSHHFERRAGYRIIHECCPLVVEIKSFPKRRLKPDQLKKEILARLADAKQDLGFQCYHLFKKYDCALQTIAIAASGDHWTHQVVSRRDVPRGAGDLMDTETWDAIKFPDVVVLGSPASDVRVQEITNYLSTEKPHQQ